jgi:hypothetical protein
VTVSRTDAASATRADAATVCADRHPVAGRPRPHVSIDAAVAAVPRDAAPAPRSIDAAPAPTRGSLTFTFDAWCDLSIDGVSVGRADPHKSYPADAGTHSLACTQGQGLPTWTGTTTVIAGESTPVTGHLLANVRVKVSVTAGDSVRIGGTTYPNGAVVELKPGRIRVEVVKGSTTVTTGWVSLPRIPGCALQDQPDLDCYP